MIRSLTLQTGLCLLFLLPTLSIGVMVADLNAQDPPPPPTVQLTTPRSEPAPPAPVTKETKELPDELTPALEPRDVVLKERASLLSALRIRVRQLDKRALSQSLTISPLTPADTLLPSAPKNNVSPHPLLGADLSRVPEIQFEAPLAKSVTPDKARRHHAQQLAKIGHLNKKKTDNFMETLLAKRPDLAGLPVAMGEACRTKGDDNLYFHVAVEEVREAMQEALNASPENVTGRQFWDAYRRRCAQSDNETAAADWCQSDALTRARVAALMQMLAPESQAIRLGLARHLSTLPHLAATQALAKLALFTSEQDVGQAAVDALKLRRERDYTPILLQGFRYPLPAVAQRASAALVRLERTDLLPQLVAVLEQPDPRQPETKDDGTVVRELVKVNHHRNCMLCHAPTGTGEQNRFALTAAVPIPGEDLPMPGQGYDTSSPELEVRIDVVYLRQDFSLRLPVADAHPWPELQRFDFLVRQRTLTADEAKAYRAELGAPEPNRPTPYHRAALAALRELTGQDAEPTAAAWRRLIEKPQP